MSRPEDDTFQQRVELRRLIEVSREDAEEAARYTDELRQERSTYLRKAAGKLSIATAGIVASPSILAAATEANIEGSGPFVYGVLGLTVISGLFDATEAMRNHRIIAHDQETIQRNALNAVIAAEYSDTPVPDWAADYLGQSRDRSGEEIFAELAQFDNPDA